MIVKEPSTRVRSGMAPLEMVMVLPVLVAVFMLIMFVGHYMFHSAFCIAEARNDAWHKRYTEARAEAYRFKDPSDGEVKGTSERRINISQLFSTFPQPRSQHLVLGDAWHAVNDSTSAAAEQRYSELNSHWNAKLQAKMLKYMGINYSESALDIGNMASNLPQAIASEVSSSFGSVLGGLSSSQSQNRAEGARQQEKARQVTEKNKDELRNKIKELDGEIERLDIQIQQRQGRATEIRQLLKKSDIAAPDSDDKLAEEQEEELDKELETIVKKQLPNLQRKHRRKKTERDGVKELYDLQQAE